MGEKTTTARTWLKCDGQDFRKLIFAGLTWLDRHRDHVNALNVFPVPDGDTGTNMLLTMRSAYKRIEDDTEELHIGRMAEKVRRGAMMGARGNSGVILSQIWRGFAESVKEKEEIDAQDFVDAFQNSADVAYNGVITPVEGTILTVSRSIANAASDAAYHTADLRYMLTQIVEHSQQALAKTPDQLPVLKQAGVVDSGGQGLVYIFEGMLRRAHGERFEDGEDRLSFRRETTSAQALARPEDGNIENPYDVQFILLGNNLDVERIRGTIDSMGDSTLVVGDSETIKVHVHVKDPGQPLSYGASLGAITDVVVENMQEQMEEIIAGGMKPSANGIQPPTIEPGQIGVVAVAPGKGLRDAFMSMGVCVLINGGQTNNPSTEEIFAAIQDVPSDKVIVLPNNKNILLAAEAARDLSTKNVVVLPTRTVPQGMCAMVGYDRAGELDDVVAAMEESAEDVATAEITTAVRDVTLDGVDVAAGQLISIVDGKLCASGADLTDLLHTTLDNLEMDDCEIVTLYYGADVSAHQAQTIADQIEALYPDVEVELVSGGQPHYHYILGAE